MTAYNPPLTGGLRLTFQGKQIGIWINPDTGGGVGATLAVMYLDPTTGWYEWVPALAGPMPDGDFQAAITAAGGIVNWLKAFIPTINAILVKLFSGAAPAPPPAGAPYSIDNVNAALASSFTLTAGATAPVFAAK